MGVGIRVWGLRFMCTALAFRGGVHGNADLMGHGGVVHELVVGITRVTI